MRLGLHGGLLARLLSLSTLLFFFFHWRPARYDILVCALGQREDDTDSIRQLQLRGGDFFGDRPYCPVCMEDPKMIQYFYIIIKIRGARMPWIKIVGVLPCPWS
jgi:hypothetical protein